MTCFKSLPKDLSLETRVLPKQLNLELLTLNLQFDPIKPLPNDDRIDTEEDVMVDKFMSLVNFETPLSYESKKGLVDSIPASTKSKTW